MPIAQVMHMSTKHHILFFNVMFFGLACHFPPAAPEDLPVQETKSAFTLYEQHNYSAAAASFERLLQRNPNARLCYYAALANRASAKELRAQQLFQYVISNYPNTLEASYCKQALAKTPLFQAPQPSAPEKAASQQDLPESVKNSLAPDMQALLDTPDGRQAVKEIIQEKAEEARKIQKAENQGILTKDTIASIKQSSSAAIQPHHSSDHPISGADIARDGANGIVQSHNPNCWFEASMAALAQLPKGQNLLANLIISTDSDSYTVHFPNDGAEYVITQKDLEATGAKDNAIWASVIECAELEKFPNNEGLPKNHKGESRVEVGLSCLTGCQAEVILPARSSDGEISSFIQKAVQSQNPIVAATQPLALISDLPLLVVPEHAYTILALDSSKNMITLRNPHGWRAKRFDLASDPKHLEFEQLDNGVFKMSIDTFQKYFRIIARSFI